MEPGGTIKKQGFEIPMDLFLRIKGTCGHKNIKLKDATKDAWLAWLSKIEGEPSPVAQVTQIAYPARHQQLHDKLEKILASGDEETITAISQNIEVFQRGLKPPLPPEKQRRAK